MAKPQKIIQLLMALILMAGLLAPAGLQLAARPVKVQAALAAAVATAPDDMVRVMVQKAGTGDQAEALVRQLGGEVTKDFDFINYFAAELPGAGVAKLGRSASVNWVALDAPMALATTGDQFVADYFNTWFYNNNDGTDDWLNNWVEFGAYEGDDPISGYVFLTDNKLAFHYLYYGEGIWRSADLSGMETATLSFDWETGELDEGEHLSVLISDGNQPFVTLDTLTGTQTGTASYDISDYISAQTTVRFESLGLNWAYGEHVYIDNVKIEYAAPPSTFYLDTLGIDQLHAAGLTGQGVTVAVVDSGIANHADFAGRLLSPPEYGIGDPYGHGTHVAGIIGGDGSASGGLYKGIAPGANLVSLGVTDANGMSYESDVVEALQWVFENSAQYNIQVVNLSLNSTVEDSYNNSAIDAASEMLWFKGVVVVASAGNSGANGAYNNAKAAPANDPFIIVVGASDEFDTATKSDDVLASFSAYGYSLDNHLRPDIIAPGYNIYAPLSPESSWDITYPERLAFGGQYIRLSGTSMAAPMAAGTVALLLEDEPNLTPDQVKYRLQQTASGLPDPNGRTSWSYLNGQAAVFGTSSTAANQGLIPHQILAKMALMAYWASQNGGDTIDWGSVNWDSVNWDSVNWDSVNWDSVNWDSVNWDSVNWDSVNWDSVNWDSVNWDSVNWDSVNWNSVNWDSVNWDSVNWNSGGLNYLVGEGSLSQDTGLFWGELDRETSRTAACDVPIFQKGQAPQTDCSMDTGFEKKATPLLTRP